MTTRLRKKELLEQHQKSMRDIMETMHSSRDEMKMGMMSGGPRSGKSMPKGAKLHHHLLEKRIDMMSMMMDQMLKHDEMMHSLHEPRR